MAQEDKAKAILEWIAQRANEGLAVAFEHDCGGFSLTISVGCGFRYASSHHTHVGHPTQGTLDDLVDQLHALLIQDRGLSWHPDAGSGQQAVEYKEGRTE